MKRFSLMGAAMALVVMGGTSRADFTDGFEVANGAQNVSPSVGLVTVGVGSLDNNFSVTAGSVDLVNTTATSPFASLGLAGSQDIDLIGTGTGLVNTITTKASFAAGTYTISFLEKNNPGNGGTTVSHAGVNITGGFTTLHVDATDVAGMDTLTFTTTGGVIAFTSTGGSNDSGILLDNITVLSAVPEPASMTLLGLGAVGAIGMIRRRKTA